MSRDFSDVPYDSAGQVIRIKADALARGYGLDGERVQRIMGRTATDAYGGPLQPPVLGQDNLEHGLQFRPTLEEALAYLPAEEALSVFEHADLTALARRVDLVAYLATPAGAYHTLDELADLLDRFGRHLDRNRDALLWTGYPREGFGRSPWLDWHLSLLSPTKLPVSAFDRPADLPPPYDGVRGPLAPHRVMLLEEEGMLPRDEEGNLVYSFVWATETGALAWGSEGPLLVRRADSFEHLVPVEWCGYADAALVEGLPSGLALRLEEGRATLLRAKLDVLQICVRCLRSRDAVALWPAVLGTLTEALLWDDMQRYLGVEELYCAAELGERVAPSYWLQVPDEVPGSLSALLTLVGHVEKELRIGTVAETKAVVGEPLARADQAGIESYFQAVGHPGQGRLDAALDGFWTLEEQERSFWDAFRQRVNAALETEFRDEVVVRVPVKRKLVAMFEPYLQTFAEWQRAQLEATGMLAPLNLSSPSESPPSRPNVFRRDGQVWTIEYAGKLVRLPDAKGLRYLAILLAEPNREFYVLDLVRRVAGTPTDPNRAQTGLDLEVLADLNQGSWGFGDAGDMIDDDALTDLKRRLEAIDEKMALGDSDGAEHLRTEQEAVVDYLAAALGLSGRPRKANSTVDQARSAVTKRINDARKRISEHHPALGRHLRSVRTGTYCRYAPDSPVDWDI